MDVHGNVTVDGAPSTLEQALASAPQHGGTLTISPSTGELVELWDAASAHELRDCYRTLCENRDSRPDVITMLEQLCRAAYLRLRPARPGELGVAIDYVASSPISLHFVDIFAPQVAS